MAPLLAIHEKITAIEQNLKDLKEMLSETKDQTEKEMLES
jgi:hypothetical protein